MVKNRLIYSLLLIASLLQASSAQAQPVDHNYVLTSTPLDAGGGNLRLVQFANGCQTEYVYGARRYDAALPMWDKPDQRCEDY